MSRKVQVKICGITNLDDAVAAVDAGADFLGFIFYPPSKRAATAVDAARIVAHLRRRPDCPVLVGVFVNETPAHMAAVLDQCDLDLAQLSGEEVPSIVNDPNSILYGRCYKALRPQSAVEADADAEWYVTEAPGIRPTLLLDAYHPTLKGGTGDLSDWEIGKQIASVTDGLMLAGGLNPDNVARAVQAVRPFAVDVASGVEAVPGRKDQAAVRDFINHAKNATIE